jgi:hypothetical protein
VVPAWVSDIEQSYQDDPHFKAILEQILLNDHSVPDYTVHTGILRYKGKICIGAHTDLRTKVLSSLHSSPIGGHSGIRDTYQRIKRLFYWHKLKLVVETFVSQCPTCKRAKAEDCQYPGLLASLPILDLAWSFISMDFIEGLPKSNNKNFILVVVDRLTKYTHFIALSHPFTTQNVAQLFIDNVFTLHGPHVAIVSDRDRIFTSRLWQDIFKSLNISLHFSSAYHPQTYGQIERVNQCLESYLRCMTFMEPKKWPAWLALAEWWYNTNYHTSLQSTPFQALYGYNPPLISKVLIPQLWSSCLRNSRCLLD